MNMSKKFLTMAVLTLAMQRNVQAYDISVVKADVAEIVDFVHALKNETNSKAKETAKELQRIANEWMKPSKTSQECARQAELIRSIKKIINSHKNNDEKVVRILEVMPKKHSRLAAAYATTKTFLSSLRTKLHNAGAKISRKLHRTGAKVGSKLHNAGEKVHDAIASRVH